MERFTVKKDYFDSLAPFYRKYSDKKGNYLKTIDNLIVKNKPRNANNILDVGAGDGRRGTALAKKMKIKEIILVDPSIEMIKICRKLKPTAVWHSSAEDIPIKHKKFDIILCLWNVLGHIKSRQRRVKALKKMKENLSSGGLIFLDVNNRHNASSYGWIKVIGRILIDTILPDEKRGDATYNLQINKKTFQGKGHLFTPSEIISLIKEAGLKIKNKYYVDYRTGILGKTYLEGQIFYVAEK